MLYIEANNPTYYFITIVFQIKYLFKQEVPYLYQNLLRLSEVLLKSLLLLKLKNNQNIKTQGQIPINSIPNIQHNNTHIIFNKVDRVYSFTHF